MTTSPDWASMTPAEQAEWLGQVKHASDHRFDEAKRIEDEARAAREADNAESRALIADPSLTPDERVARFAADRVRHLDVSLWNEDGNRIPHKPEFLPAFEHIRRCGTLYVDNVTGVDIVTGHCPTCCETSYGLRFDAACTCGYRQPGLVWEGGSTWEADDIFDAMDQALR